MYKAWPSWYPQNEAKLKLAEKMFVDLVPEGIDGFIDALGLGRCEEVRLADCHGQYEEHLPPGQGRIDFRHLFRRLERDPNFNGHYMCAFGSLEVMLAGREYLAKEAEMALGDA